MVAFIGPLRGKGCDFRQLLVLLLEIKKKQMNVKEAYNQWSKQYDSNDNKTRDLEGVALRQILAPFSFGNILEIGCGTGKNTAFFVTKTKHITAVDLSEKMLEQAQSKPHTEGVDFIQADITLPWNFAQKAYDLVSFSLILEHIEDLDTIFQKTTQVLKQGGYVYIGELHPFKQYSGTKARFETEEGLQIVTCFNHHVSDFTQLAQKYGLEIIAIDEHFDDGDKTILPRILTVLLRKK
jgi:ubiquinone/menaquinone biosynthesis C-methylase UbiE